ncbi:MAG TPA: glycosyltransferase family 2 protein [Candidatus Paceibacterota bacterium]|nr:glycosyltransferase family 2 protein [Candidatus Paceibacterota bacterium]
MKVAVIIPTYNEAGAIGGLLDELAGVLSGAPRYEWRVLVVDANSPDGTAGIVRAAAERHPGLIELLEEPEKRGIAAAYLLGMRYAIDTLRADVFVEFDGDGQHDPRDIPRLIRALEEGADYAIGSRYVEGGAIPREWALYRKILSRFGSLYARLLLELPVHDATSGLKATRVATLAAALPLEERQLVSRQYAYKLQFLYAAALAGARIREIPITFRMRAHDISKSAAGDIFESLRLTLILRARTLARWRLLRVALVSGAGLLFQAAFFEIAGVWLHLLAPSIAVLIAGELAVFLNFALHERFSFRDKREAAAPLAPRLVRFQILSLLSIAAQWILVHAAELAGAGPLLLNIAYALGVALGFLAIYAGAYFWVWGARADTGTSAL